MAPKTAYGANPHADRNPNADNGWGGYQWPGGVPANLLSVVTVPGNVKIVVRSELAELVGLNYRIADVKYGRRFTRGWTGGYENRAIAGTRTPSNHSKGKAIDNDAQDNPMSATFQCNIPPELVADWEAVGFYWGGRYTGKSDTMHFEYCYSPGDVPGHLARAKAILDASLSGKAGAAVAAVPSNADGWPCLPSGHFLGPVEGPQESHSGDRRFDGQDVRDAVAYVQRRVTELGFDAGGADGIYGQKTGTAVTAWQAANGYIQSGLVGHNDWAALHAAPAAGAPAFSGALKQGATGPGVDAIQLRLIALHAPGVDAEHASQPGSFGPVTDAAVRWFQTDHGLEVDGIVGPQTWGSLFR